MSERQKLAAHAKGLDSIVQSLVARLSEIQRLLPPSLREALASVKARAGNPASFSVITEPTPPGSAALPTSTPVGSTEGAEAARNKLSNAHAAVLVVVR